MSKEIDNAMNTLSEYCMNTECHECQLHEFCYQFAITRNLSYSWELYLIENERGLSDAG